MSLEWGAVFGWEYSIYSKFTLGDAAFEMTFVFEDFCWVVLNFYADRNQIVVSTFFDIDIVVCFWTSLQNWPFSTTTSSASSVLQCCLSFKRFQVFVNEAYVRSVEGLPEDRFCWIVCYSRGCGSGFLSSQTSCTRSKWSKNQLLNFLPGVGKCG